MNNHPGAILLLSGNIIKKFFFIALFSTAGVITVTAQQKIKDASVSGNNLPNKDAVLELESANKGILHARVALRLTTNAFPLSAHVAGMMVYNTATINDVVPGIYYNDGSKWVFVRSSNGILVENQPGTTGTPGTPGTAGGPGAGVTIVNNDSGTWVFNSTTNTWTNIRGAQGPQGPQGLQGIQGVAGTNGTNGADGKSVNSGTGTPTGGNNGDTYINTTTGDIYTNTGGVWSVTGNIRGPQGPQGLQGIQGVAGTNGINGVDGKSVNSGTGTPTGGNNGDTYINTTTGDVYTNTGGVWSVTGNIRGPQGLQGIQGLQGTQGIQGVAGTNGTNGTNGLDGKSVNSGTGTPTGGNNGDTYINTTTGDVYTNTGGVWSVTGNIRGPQGLQGLQGLQGTQGIQGVAGTNGTNGLDGKSVSSGTSAPIGGNNGDTYINTTTGDVYTNTGGVWSVTGNIRGPQGLQGIQGPQGLQGIQGVAGTNGTNGLDGKSVSSGTGAPTGGNNGDTYVNTTTGNVYTNTGGVWSVTGNIRGPQGPAGTTAAVTADNGLTKTLDNIQLGGLLTKSTVITADATKTLAIAGLQTGTSADNLVVADASGVLKSVPFASTSIEPWNVENTTTKATTNSQNIYQNGKVGIGDFSSALTTKQFEVKGNFKSEVISGNTSFGTEVASSTNPLGAMHYWQNNTNGDYRVSSANSTSAVLSAKTGTTTNTISVEQTQAALSSQNGTNSLSGIRSTDAGNFFMESYNVTGNFGSTISLQNDGMRLRHTNTNGALDPFPLNNSSEIFIQKVNGVRFNFRDASAVQTGEYWFPTTSGADGQVMTQTPSGKMVWTSPSALVTEVDGIIGNEVTSGTTNGGLTRAGAGTAASPYTLGLTPGSAAGNVMTWDGTAWNPSNPVNLYNANGTLVSNRSVIMGGRSLRFTSPERDILFDSNGRIGTEAKGTNDADIYLSSGSGSTYNRFDIQSFSNGQVNLTMTGAGAEQMTIGTHMTTTPAPLAFSTSAGSNASATERMRITGTGNVGVNTELPTEKLDNNGITRLRNLPLNGATNAINTTIDGDESSSQDQTFTATRTVVADANGVLGTVAGLPAAPTNIYTANGTLTSARTLTLGGFPLNFSGTEQTVTLSNTGWLGINAKGTNSSFMRMSTTDGNANGVKSNFDMQLFPDNMMQMYATDEVSSISFGTHETLNPSPIDFVTSPGGNAPGQIRMTVTPTGEVAIGTTTASSFVVGGSTIQPKLHVAGDISTTGKLWTTNSVYADYVFEDYFNGFSKIYKDYKFKSLKEVAEFIKKNKHLPGVTPIHEVAVGKNGYTIDLTQLSMQQLEKLEELYLHVIEMNDVIGQKDKEIKALQVKTNELEERLKKLESLLIKK